MALNRIAVFLDEEEVTDQVSCLKKDSTLPYLPGADHEGLGLDNASLRWNTVLETKNQDKHKIPEHSASIVLNETSRTEDTLISSSIDRIFELDGVSVKFPEGQLTIVTGPTASGKTALLVRLFSVVLFIDLLRLCPDGSSGRNDTAKWSDYNVEGNIPC